MELTYQQYMDGVDYKTRIGLYTTVDLNERFFANDQWYGIPHDGLPTPMLNIIDSIVQWKKAAVADRRTKLQYSAQGQATDEDDITARQISDYSDVLWERLKMDYLTKEGLQDAALTGDYIQYFYWDSELHTGQYAWKEESSVDENGLPVMKKVRGKEYRGDINTQIIDNVNYYPGDPNQQDVQKQPYIILVFREHIDFVKADAKKYGANINFEITGDSDTDYTSGDMGKIELDDDSKINVFLKLYKKDGKVYAEKSIRQGVLRPAWDTKLTRYPIAMMNWKRRKNSCHGVAEVTGLIPNQVFINKILAFSHLIQMLMSTPKVLYDATLIKRWTNKIGQAIAVNGSTRDAAFVLNPSTNNFDSDRLLRTTKELTMELTGATNITLGNITNPDNTSAFIATRDAAMVPLQSVQERYYSFLEDVGMIWLDFMGAFYKDRMIPISDNDQTMYVPMPDISNMMMRIKIDVGPSTMWSEIQQIQTVDNLLKMGKITFSEYLDRLPKGLIPKTDELKQAYSELDTLQMEAMKAQFQTQITQAAIMAMQLQGGIPPQPQTAA